MVKDTNGVQLPFATVRIVGSSIGTMCDKQGNYEILLPQGSYQFVFSYVGFKGTTIAVDLQNSVKQEIRLYPIDIQLPEVLIDGEDPAYAIMREAIVRKRKWQQLISSFKARVYTKDTFGRDTLLSLISEAYSDLYWQKNDSLKEVVIYRRQSSNLPEQFQFALVRDFFNFNNDTIRHWGYTFITPLSDSALQFYDYKLKRTYSDAGQKYYDIEVTPLSQTQPLFSGRITISDSSYALQSVQLHPNNVFKIPFFEFLSYEFSQQFSLYENRFWFPLEYHISAEMKFRYMLIKFPNSIFYNKSVICYEYVTNPFIEDSIIALPSLTLLPSIKNDDTSKWKNITYFPLSKLEEKSYAIIDRIFKSRPFFSKVTSFLIDYENTINAIDFRYNRVEGAFLGGKISKNIATDFRFSANAGYGFADHFVNYTLQPEILLHSKLSLWFGAGNYRSIQTFPLNYHVNGFLNSVSALFNGDDYYNYYDSRGNRIFLTFDKYPNVFTTLSFVIEKHSSVSKATDFALNFIGTKKKFRDNTSITDGSLRAFRFELYNKVETIKELFEEPKDSWLLRIEHSSSDFGSSFNFTSFYSNVALRIPTMGTSRLFNPYLGVSASLGLSNGSAPIQRVFSFETPISNIAFPNSFRTMKNFEFLGDNYYACSIEHNFRNIPLLLLGISFINADLILKISTGAIWVTSPLLKNNIQTLQGRYSEYTIGIGRIADVFRIDFSYSDYKQSRYAVTILGGF